MTAPELDLAAVKATAEAATKGPWSWAGNTDTGEPRLISRGGDVLAIGWDERSTTGRDADAVREYAAESGLDGDAEVALWAHDQYGYPIKEPRLWFYTDHLADPARDRVIYEVAPSATTREDPAVYRADIVGVRHPDAEHIATMDPTTTLALVDRLERAEREVARLRGEEWSIWDQGAIMAIEQVRDWIDDDADSWRVHENPYDLGNPHRMPKDPS